MPENLSFPQEACWDTTVATYDADKNRRLKLSSQMKMQQEVGEIHLENCGLPYAVLYEKGIVFVLTRSRAVIYRQPELEEKVHITTWERECKGVQFFRCYRFTDAEGNILIDSCSAFAMVDPASHKLLRPKVFHELCNVENRDKETTCPSTEKITLPEIMTPAGTRLVRYSDIDYNGHLNNTVYADLLCDFVPGGMNGRQVREFALQYVSEAVEGDELEISVLGNDNAFYFCGNHTRGRCFDGYLRFTE